MARESRFTRTMKQKYITKHLELDTTFKKTQALLEVYREAYWSVSKDFEDLNDYSFEEFSDSDTVLNYLLTFAPEQELQFFSDRVQNAAESRILLDLINKAVVRMKDYPIDGEKYYDILNVTYLYYTKSSIDDVLDMLEMERSTYYRKKKEAITLLGFILFGNVLPEAAQHKVAC